MPRLDPAAEVIVRAMTETFPRIGTDVLDAAEARRILAAAPRPDVEPIPVARIEDRTIPVPSSPEAPDAHEIPVRIYWPEPAGEAPPPVVVFFHGGGWTLCGLDTHDQTCRAMTRTADVITVSVDYRLAPEHAFPAAAEDAYAATCWSAQRAATELSGDPRRLAVAGDSAGGNLAAAVTLMARDRGGPAIAFQLLVYPVLDHRQGTASYRENAQGFFLTADHMRWYWQQYTGGDGSHPYASPLLASDLAGLPPAHIVTAECDPLRDEGEAYGRRLREAGVAADVRRYDGMFHGFFGMRDLLPASRQAEEAAFAAVRAMPPTPTSPAPPNS